MWPFKKKPKLWKGKLPPPPINVRLNIRMILTEHDFENNYARVKELADKLEPVVHMLRTKQRYLTRLGKHLSLSERNTMSEDTTTPGEDQKPADAGTPDGQPAGEAPAAE